MIVTDSTKAVLYVFGVWNEIAELTGDIVDQSRIKFSQVISEFDPPPFRAFFWTPTLIGWLREQADVFSAASEIVVEALEDWRTGVIGIVNDAIAGELPLPKKLGQKLMRADDAWRMTIQVLFSSADSISFSKRDEYEATILEVAAPGRSTSVDDDPDQTMLQKAWRGVVKVAVAFVVATVPFALAWTAAVAYVAIWAAPSKALTKALPQDSKRLSGGFVRRTRQNKKTGPDL